MDPTKYIFDFMVVVFFLAGLTCTLFGLTLLLAREFRDAMKKLSANSSALLAAHSAVSGKSANDAALVPIMDSASKLIESVSNLIRTSTGVGAFMCLMGVAIDAGAIWMFVRLR